MEIVNYVVDKVERRTFRVEYNESCDNHMSFPYHDESDTPFGGNIVDQFSRDKFTSPMSDIDELYNEVKRVLTYRLEPKMYNDGSTIVCHKLAKGNGVNPNRSEIFDWIDGNFTDMTLIEFRFRVVRITESVDFKLDGILEDDGDKNLVGFAEVKY